MRWNYPKRAISIILIIFAIIMGIYSWYLSTSALVIISWNTASEIDTAGYNIFRKVGQEGDYIQVNRELIIASGDVLTGGSYQYIDHMVQENVTYTYILEDVSLDGKTNRHGPIQVTAEARGKIELLVACIFGIIAIINILSAGKEDNIVR